MRLVRVQKAASPCRVFCASCGELRREVECYADFDGTPGTYYCQECADKNFPAETDGQFVVAQEHTNKRS